MIFNKYNLIVYLINNNGMQIAKHTTFFEPKFHEIRFIVSFDFFWRSCKQKYSHCKKDYS
ncbi:hypothetical protein BGAPBR_K0027 (plasmid) [Borreliella garinii PBr]|uniref:Uncharacterized protein n=1 Tax=Borreliella garinii PBr TaxID=498743 RepID=B8F0R0_BORGR|nr:hypothetical protein BGAPBR_K0027 [Borreliella garinii PBr]